ncbi:MAG: ATP-dependent DNA helicase, partial [Lachnospiraceae bacterium]
MMSATQTVSTRRIRISVRNLVEFLLRSGDLDNRRETSAENAMAEGGRIHRLIQRRMGSEYHSEVSLKFREVTSDYELVVEGRADGIIILPDQITIDEIKGTYRELERITKPEPVHLAQAKCYAY